MRYLQRLLSWQTPARLRSTARQFDVGVGKRNHPCDPQVFGRFGLIDLIERNFPSQRAVTKFERVIAVTSGHGQRFMTELDERR